VWTPKHITDSLKKKQKKRGGKKKTGLGGLEGNPVDPHIEQKKKVGGKKRVFHGSKKNTHSLVSPGHSWGERTLPSNRRSKIRIRKDDKEKTWINKKKRAEWIGKALQLIKGRQNYEIEGNDKYQRTKGMIVSIT